MVTRIDPTINFNWGTGSPDPKIAGNTFSARWTGKVLAQKSETYTFTTHTNNGVRLWVDNELLIEDWNDQPVIDHTATIALKAGQLYDVKMEYYNDTAGAVAELRWSTPTTTTAIIPQAQLYPSSALSNAYATFSLLHKVALLVNTFKLTIQEVAYLSDPAHSAIFAHFDLNALPLVRLDNTNKKVVALFQQWEQINDFITLRNIFSGGNSTLIDVFSAATASADPTKLGDATLNSLLAVTGWDAKALALLTDSSVFNLTDGDFGDATIILPRILALQNCFAMSDRLGISFDHLLDWATKDPDAGQAQDVKNTVKAQFDDDQWLTVAKSLNDGLRENQRTALIAYLLHIQQIKDAGISDSSQLYEYFLIDVDMDACMLTSRIVQANATVQLFVQRCLINLEPEVSPDAIDAGEWLWMKRYRTWEANRQVFLYPENWIEPGLRDNKTSFFKELETELLQNEITLDTAEQAFLNYLEKLDQVARLEICGIYWQEEDPDIGDTDWRDVPTPQTNILHVFGRTFAIPHIYYYRQLLVNTMVWTPWEKVNVDIEGDHLIPVVYNRRLHILWPIFTEKPNSKGQSQAGGNTQGTSPNKQLEIKLGWSEYKQNKWSAKQVSLDSLPPIEQEYRENDVFDRSLYTFKALVEDQQLKIRVYFNSALAAGVSEFASFVFKDCRGRIAIDTTHSSCLVPLVEGSYRFMTLREPDNSTQLNLVYDYFGNEPHPICLTPIEIQPTNPLLILQRTSSRYDLVYPHQYYQFAAQAPFFYQDDERTYFVSPEDLSSGRHFLQPDSIIPPLDRATEESAITNNGSNAGNLSIIDHAALATAKERAVAVSAPAAPTIPSTSVGMTTVAPPITNEGGGAKTQPLVVLGSTVSTSGAGTALPGTARKDFIIRPFGGGVPLPSTRFISFYHPHVCNFIRSLNQGGIPSLLTLDTQRLTNDVQEKGIITRFELEYLPNSLIVLGENSQYVDTPYPLEDVDFEYSGAYSLYNWELFFHIPMLIATRLSKNQRFAEAQQWFHYIFNPTDSSTDSGTQSYWKVLCFQSTVSERLQDLLKQVDDPSSSIHAQILRMERKPFQPACHCPYAPHRLPEKRGDEVHRQFDRLGRSIVPAGHDGVNQRSDPTVHSGLRDTWAAP